MHHRKAICVLALSAPLLASAVVGRRAAGAPHGLNPSHARSGAHPIYGRRPEVGVSAESRIRALMQGLASDAMRGRGSGTPDELRAGRLIASQLQKMGVRPAGDLDASGRRSFIQTVDLSAPDNEPGAPPRQTRNVLGLIPGSGSAPKKGAGQSREVILLSAHMDHLGVNPDLPGQDKIYNGADDDASGCIAVLELARSLALGSRSRRTVCVAFFGSEETGGAGARYFLSHLPFDRKNLVANLEFEMIGRADPAVSRQDLWLTGYERSNLGPELARQGAHLVPDPHPEENFFRRSDNYALAREGVVAHTVSSFGLHRDYHRPSDDIAHIDFAHMARAIASMQKPVRWLANSNFKPAWNPGGAPGE